MRILNLKDTLEVVRDTRCLHCMGKRQKPRDDEFRERVEMIIVKTLTGEARIDTRKDRIAETE